MLQVKLSEIQIKFLANCITMASRECFYYVDADIVTLAMNDFGFTEEEIKEVCSGYVSDDDIVEKKLTNFFSK